MRRMVELANPDVLDPSTTAGSGSTTDEGAFASQLPGITSSTPMRPFAPPIRGLIQQARTLVGPGPPGERAQRSSGRLESRSLATVQTGGPQPSTPKR